MGALFLFAVLVVVSPGAKAGAAPQQPRRIVINLPSRTLSLYEGEVLLKQYPVGVGNPATPSPLGSYRVIVKVMNPTWYPKGRTPVPPGPANPIGTRWLGLSAPGIGIHGTNAPASIGQAVSGGCLRLTNAAVEELFPLVEVGTPVELTYETVQLSEASLGQPLALAAYPDLYRRGTPGVSEVAERLWAAGLHAELDTPELERRLAMAAEVFAPAPVIPRISVSGRLAREARWLDEGLWLRLSEAGELVGTPLLVWEGKVLRVDGEDWIPAAELAGRAGFRLKYVPARATLYLTAPLVFWQGTPVARAFCEPDGGALVPLRSLAEAAGRPVAVDDCLLVAVGEGGRSAGVVRRGEEAYLDAERAAGLLGLEVRVDGEGFWFDPEPAPAPAEGN